MEEKVDQPQPEEPKQEKKKKEGIDWRKVLRLFIVPIVAITMFLGILFLLIVPEISNTFSKLDDLTAIRERTEGVIEVTTQLAGLNSRVSQVQLDLDSVNKIAPVGNTEVVLFQQKIADLARQNSLLIISSKTEEQVLTVEGDNPILGINEIPSTFSLNGRFQNIQNFIEGITTLEDFVIIGEMQIRAVDSVGPERLTDQTLQWNILITLIKYQFQEPNEQNKLAEAYIQVPPTVSIEEKILEFIRAKFASDTPQTEDTTQ